MSFKYCNTASSPQGKGKGIPNNWTSNSKSPIAKYFQVRFGYTQYFGILGSKNSFRSSQKIRMSCIEILRSYLSGITNGEYFKCMNFDVNEGRKLL